MSHNHSPTHAPHEHPSHEGPSAVLRLSAATVLNVGITTAEVIGGLLSGSLALLSDALHNLSDSLSLVLSAVAQKISGRSRNRRKTFGYQRAGIVAALINSVLLIAVSVLLLQEALVRLFDPQPVHGLVVLVTATIGLGGNLISALFLHHHSHESLNVRSSFLHLLADTLASGAVLVGGVVIFYTHWYWLDAGLSLTISLYIFIEVYRLLKTTLNILMQGAPQGFNIAELEAAVRKVPEVFNIHHVHVWSLDEHEQFLEAHLNLNTDLSVSQTQTVVAEVGRLVKEQFHITHTTFQVEYECCPGVGAIVEEAR